MLASFPSLAIYTLAMCNPICLLAFCCQHGVQQWALWELTPVLPVVLFAVWCASPCGQTKPSSPRHDAWSDNNLQKPAQTQRERQWVHLQQQDGQITLRAHQGIHVHTRANVQIEFTSEGAETDRQTPKPGIYVHIQHKVSIWLMETWAS